MTSIHVGLIRLAVMSLLVLAVVAQVGTAGPQATLVEEVRRSTARFNEVAVAEKAGYAPFLGCVSGPQEGAMGLHYVNGDLVGDGRLDAQQPEALMYEVKDGRLMFVDWNPKVSCEGFTAAHSAQH